MILLVIAAIMLIGIILIQSSKGGGLAGSFGGSDASMVFGVRRTADFLIKITSVLAGALLIFSLVTNVIINKGGGSQENIIQQNNGQQFPQQQVPQNLQQNQQQPDQNNQQPNNTVQPNNQQPNNQQPDNKQPDNKQPDKKQDTKQQDTKKTDPNKK